jgi:hypothetical protein
MNVVLKRQRYEFKHWVTAQRNNGKQRHTWRQLQYGTAAMTDTRAVLAELVEMLRCAEQNGTMYLYGPFGGNAQRLEHLRTILDRARAILTAPEPEPFGHAVIMSDGTTAFARDRRVIAYLGETIPLCPCARAAGKTNAPDHAD